MGISAIQSDFEFYGAFIAQLCLFYIPAIIGVCCSVSVSHFKAEGAGVNILQLLHRIIVWASPAAVLMCVIELVIGQKCTEATRLALYGVTFFAGMVGKDLSSMFSNLHVLLRLSKSILTELTDKVDDVKDISKKIAEITDELSDNDNNKKDPKE